VGGAPMPSAVVKQARSIGLPLYEGYGLTECSSVVSVNTPAEFRDGSVGKVLPHTAVRIAGDSEIMVRGGLCAGYVHDDTGFDDQEWPTGDLGYIDGDGYLYVSGRKANAYSTAFGRNVSPEWVERVLETHPAIRQAVLFGEGKPFNVAIIVPAQADHTDQAIAQAIEQVNSSLPDYARAESWVRATEPYSQVNQQLLATGVVHRQRICSNYRNQIESIYSSLQG
jgi:long-chain acyl-CoA synthetase